MPQEDLHETVSYKVREKFEGKEILAKLEMYGEVQTADADCYLFSPKNPDWPKAYVYEDGRIFVLTENHFSDEIEEFIQTLSDILGMEIYEMR